MGHHPNGPSSFSDFHYSHPKCQYPCQTKGNFKTGPGHIKSSFHQGPENLSIPIEDQFK